MVEQLFLASPSSSEEGVGGGAAAPREVLLQRAAAMRNNPTEPEKRLWMELRDSRLDGHKFRRQAVIGARIVDFICPAKALVIEIDGETHDPQVDAWRDAAMLRDHGFRTVRFTNPDVVRNMDGVLTVLLAALAQGADRWAASGATTPRPPPLKRRGR